jgi:2-haloacid dehalogenase
MRESYRAFLLDADNTIFDYDRAEEEALAEALGDAGVPPRRMPEAREAYRRINGALWKAFEGGTVSLAELRVERFRALAAELALPFDPVELSRTYLSRLGGKAHFMPHARGVVRRLAGRALLCIVTNGISEVQRGRIARAGIGELFRGIIISEELGISKPDPRFFRAALEALGVEPPDALVVGDSLSSDIRGAAAAGIDAAWYNPKGIPLPPGEPQPGRTVGDLRELLPLAGGSVRGGVFSSILGSSPHTKRTPPQSPDERRKP